MPTFGADAPAQYYRRPEEERPKRVDLDSDSCVVDGERFIVRGCLEIPVQGESDPFVWGVWVDLSKTDFDNGIRPYVPPSDHPLHKEQCQDITADRVAEIYAHLMHGK